MTLYYFAFLKNALFDFFSRKCLQFLNAWINSFFILFLFV